MVSEQSTRARASVPPGTRYGRYEVIAEIASGGMATVFLGRALGAAGFQRLVAIKVLHPHVERDDDFVAMFMDEARLAARIRHPNVVPTLDLENSEEGLFLVMEFVEGDGLLGMLRTLFKAGRAVPAPIAVRLALDVLHGLHAAHELTGDRGEPLRLVHRDVSPHNILVGLDGVARITDFGIASAEQRIGTTREGQVKGKLAYMAPEQTESGPIDRRADVFALGVVLWECLAGRRLFWGANDGTVLKNLLQKPVPSLCELDPSIPPSLDAVVQKALARDPADRFSTAAMFAEALEEAGGSVGIASARAVGALVRELSGPRIDLLSSAARAYTADLSTSSVRPLPRTRATTDPDRTTLRSDPSALVMRRTLSSARLVPPTLAHEAGPLELHDVDGTRAERPSVRVPPRRGRPALWFAGGAALAFVLGGVALGAAMALTRHAPAATRVGATIVVGPTLTPGAAQHALVPLAQAIPEARTARESAEGQPALAANTDTATPPPSALSAEPTAPPVRRGGTTVSTRAPRRSATAEGAVAPAPAQPSAPLRRAPEAPAHDSTGFNPEAM